MGVGRYRGLAVALVAEASGIMGASSALARRQVDNADLTFADRRLFGFFDV